jgi:hypothetical protein
VERKEGGRPGLSDGCFVFSKADRDAVVSSLHGGALIYAIYRSRDENLIAPFGGPCVKWSSATGDR